MPLFLIFAVVVGLVLYRQPLVVGTVKGEIASMDNGYDSLFQRYAGMFGVDWKLVKAIAMHESSLDPSQVNPSDPSVGLMQVLCEGYPDSTTCTNKLNVSGWPPENSDRLFDPDYNVFIGTQILASNIRAYGTRKGVAVYNDWRAHTQTEPFENQAYVDTVFSIYERL